MKWKKTTPRYECGEALFFLIISSELDEVLDELKSENSAEDELEDGAYE